MVTIIYETGVYGIAIGNVQEAAPPSNHQPEQSKCGKRTVTHHPLEDASSFGIYGNPKPDFDFFEPTNV
jgi:hypothetical protein